MKFAALLIVALYATYAYAQDPVNSIVFFLPALASNPSVPSDPTVNLLPSYNDAYTNWKNAGLATVGGIPTRTTQCGSTINPSGITPPASGDDAANIQAAINACTTGDVVQLGAGTFNFDTSEYIFLDKGIVLRGTGTCNNVGGVVNATTMVSGRAYQIATVGTTTFTSFGSPTNVVGQDFVATGAATGSGTVIAPYCSTILQYGNGPLPTYNSTPQCGTSISSTSNCPGTAAAMINMGPATGFFGYGWSGFAAPPTSDNPTTESFGTPLSADAAQGATSIQVSSTANLTVGNWMLIDENPQLTTTTNPIPGQASIQATPEFLNSTGSPVVQRFGNPDSGSCTYGYCVNRDNSELHLITSIGPGPCPCTVTFDDPLTMGFRISSSHDARVYWPTQHSVNTSMPFLASAGVENLTVFRAINGGINLEFCVYCWVRNTESFNWINGSFVAIYAARSQITHNYSHNCIDCQNNGNEYPLGITAGSTEVLVDDNIILLGGKGMVGRAANTAVIAYNYQDMTFYETTAGQIGDYWLDMGVNGSHFAATHHWLFEGNWGSNCDGDETHGNADYHTFYRNWCTGYRSPFVDPSINMTVNDIAGIGFEYTSSLISRAPGPLRAAGPMAFNYWYAYVGNVLGTSAISGWTYICTAVGSSKCIWMSGWTGSEWSNNPDPNLTGSSATWLFKHANYDYVNNAIADFQTGYSHTLTNSWYTSSQPSYFGASGANCIYPWPWVTPTGTSQVQTPTGTGCTSTDGLPAKARFDAGTPFVQP